MVDENNYIVYMHENKANGKKYFGMTGQDPEKRWLKGTNYRTCTAMKRAFEKYGWDGFNHVIIQSGMNRNEACELEQKLIAENNTQNPEYGYNICAGGGGMVGFHHSEETKKHLSEVFSGPRNQNYKKPLPEWRKALLLKANIGSKHTEEHKRKISESCRGKIHHDESFKQRLAERNKHPVIRDDGVYFDTVNDAAESVGVTPSAISNAMRRNNRSGGHYWKLAELKA